MKCRSCGGEHPRDPYAKTCQLERKPFSGIIWICGECDRMGGCHNEYCSQNRVDLDGDWKHRKYFSAAIDGAMSKGYENSDKPPTGHWLTIWWEKGRYAALAEEELKIANQRGDSWRDLFKEESDLVGKILAICQWCVLEKESVVAIDSIEKLIKEHEKPHV